MKKVITICMIIAILGTTYAMAGWTTLDYPDAKWTDARGIDGSNIVGDYGDYTNNYHGFIYNGITWTTLDKPGASSTVAFGIDGRNIVGDSFLYNGTTWTTLDYPDAKWTDARGIDGSNIVGDYGDDTYNYHGFIYNGITWTTLDKPEASSIVAFGIDGSNIVGNYGDASGVHGFLYTIPEPTTLLLLGLGAFAIASRRSP